MLFYYLRLSALSYRRNPILSSLMVLAGASVILVNANKSSRIQDDLVGMQENARFAVQQIHHAVHDHLVPFLGLCRDVFCVKSRT